ncbi:MAG TPA: hydantoinase B/oxoprolinase family protein [Syntrophorhabdaceae bacterium]|jgi:N-methylhydantoinase B|nr:hydantoinase B/oxoprolinase family protein [Syntrophorhabdaceae bacterium]MDI9561224.1 hydantoinase B/oxoprolinase family protein [Pseudomonadota bacterium]MBP8697454.1 hydantoinase B/oxoprolinase family protein [Syntrophorhabdaceae bacterium]HOS58833.1 hydantoinase B/oxoprolinase family protein [Syntrophorhabdaceae bacterium]HPH40885.1 hydantoinase B/oxoprolinase family protein [Syntrophorhabdaceae bacterium]
MMSRTFDPITLEILWRRLISIVDEADSSVARTAFSSLLRDAHDYTCMFTDSFGRELAQGSFATPGQSGAMALGIKNLVKKYPLEYYQPGDIFITNDPWALAGHLNDVCVMSPIFFKDQLVAFTACVFHHSDIGGRVASDNHDVFEEGLFIPFVRLYQKGILNESVMDMIRWNVRTPDEVIGDIRSQIAANHVCTEKICQMLKESDLDNLDDLADAIIGITEKSMREEIEKIPDGVYLSKGIIEQMKGKTDIVIQAKVEIRGSDIIVDLEGSSDQVDWGGNVVFNFTYAYVFMAVKSMFAPDVPNNDGCARPIRLSAPEGSVVNCKFPAAVAARMGVGHFLTEIIYRALSDVLPKKVIAASGGTPAAMNVFYGRRKDGKPWHSVIIRGGGMGASAKNDGNYVYIFPANGANTPVEIFESDTPLVVEKRELLADSGGVGKMKGGLGKREVFKVPDDSYAPIPPINLGIQSGRYIYPAEGLFGGKSGAKAQFLVNGVQGNSYGLTQMKPGDVVTIDAPGGGGYGNPSEREPQMVLHDVIEGYVSIEEAKSEYGVVIDPTTLEIDTEETDRLRKSKQERF